MERREAMSQSDPTLNCEPERERILSKVLMNFGEMRLEKTKNSSRKNPNFLIFSLSLWPSFSVWALVWEEIQRQWGPWWHVGNSGRRNSKVSAMVDGGVLNCVSQFGLRLSPFDRYVPSSPVICNFLIIFVTKILLSTSIQIIIFLIKSLKPNYNFFYKKKIIFFL